MRLLGIKFAGSMAERAAVGRSVPAMVRVSDLVLLGYAIFIHPRRSTVIFSDRSLSFVSIGRSAAVYRSETRPLALCLIPNWSCAFAASAPASIMFTQGATIRRLRDGQWYEFFDSGFRSRHPITMASLSKQKHAHKANT